MTRFPSENNKEKCKIIDYPDIQDVSYNSDGKTLYATLWVNPFMINQSTSYTQVKNSWISGVYQMYIDFPSVYDNGTDYIYSIKWNPLNQKWSPILEERNIGEGKNKVLGLISDREDFIDNDKKYVTFSLNRSMLNLAR